ncbi:MAG: GatB/YqeY domain-containing protein [Candidatus Omnitrophica bacterium]|nr:GatB/YqeY domain-containing protein [Candidatus Omnitrophota bacterium]MCF7877620.1 GatB/YqeY domain-containing protein [Candidatus Omnitrophota bacterium]MCF7878134.1 GatB/YqeY domain-containing protein [Candidatus Omnitrophota bacterium]MCF7893307.1 GatB/YqeY domain-containing protein [Candidatus Omnitrophota bacterium]
MIFDQIYKDSLIARKEKNQKKSQFLGYIRSELANRAKELKQEKLQDSEVLKILKKQEKKLKEAKESSKNSQREDIQKDLEIELEILSQYLPEQLSLEETEKIIDEIISQLQASSISDMGKVMKEVLAKIGAQSNPKKISEIVKKKLAS